MKANLNFLVILQCLCYIKGDYWELHNPVWTVTNGVDALTSLIELYCDVLRARGLNIVRAVKYRLSSSYFMENNIIEVSQSDW